MMFSHCPYIKHLHGLFKCVDVISVSLLFCNCVLSCVFVSGSRFMQPAQVCDLLKGLIMVLCYFMMHYVDYAMMYHLIRGQSVIKLYIIYNMLEVRSMTDYWWCLVCSVLSVLLSLGGRSSLLVLRAGHSGRSLLDGHGAKVTEESPHWSHSSFLYGCFLCLYPYKLQRPLCSLQMFHDVMLYRFHLLCFKS